MTGEFPAQGASNAEKVSIWWHHHAMVNYSALPHLSKRVRENYKQKFLRIFQKENVCICIPMHLPEKQSKNAVYQKAPIVVSNNMYYSYIP